MDLVRLLVGDVVLPLIGWMAGLTLAAFLIGLVVVLWSRRRIGDPPRSTGESVGLAVLVLVNLAAVPLAAALLSVPFVLQRSAADLLEIGAPELIAWTARRGEVLWMESSGVQANAPLPPLVELRAMLSERDEPSVPEAVATGAPGLSITGLGALASRHLSHVLGDAIEAVERSGAGTWGEAVAAVRPRVEAALTREAQSIAAAFRQTAWLELLPLAAVAGAAWLLSGVLVLLLRRRKPT